LDILRVLKENNIEYKEQGSNVKEGNVNIKCPFCKDDPSEHMGIDITTGYYGCWRNSSHRGKRIERLIAKLLGVSLVKARSVLGIGTFVDTSNFGAEAIRLLSVKEEDNISSVERKLGGVSKLKFRPELKPLCKDTTGFNREPFLKYLFERGFDDPETLAERYELMFATYSDWRYRIVAPVYYNGKLSTWVGRSISSNATLKYKDLSVDESVRHAKFCLFNHNNISKGGRRLFIVEGFFDAMKLDFYLPNERDKVTCLFTKTMSQEQADLIIKIASKYEQVLVLLDNDAHIQAMGITSRLNVFAKNVSMCMLPDTFKDPGEMTKEFIKEWGRADDIGKKAQSNTISMRRRVLARPRDDEAMSKMRYRKSLP
jgi:5S rRNA maturation endonuclease (ribonuclease M5)